MIQNILKQKFFILFWMIFSILITIIIIYEQIVLSLLFFNFKIFINTNLYAEIYLNGKKNRTFSSTNTIFKKMSLGIISIIKIFVSYLLAIKIPGDLI